MLEVLRGARGALFRRFASNASRQAAGAGLFFLSTLMLTRALGPNAYAVFFDHWNLANLITELTAFGIYNDLLRRLARGESTRSAVGKISLSQLAQIVSIGAAVWLATRLRNYDAVLLLWVACSVCFSTLLTAISLGKDWFRTFMMSELIQSIAFCLLVLLMAPSSPRAVGIVFALSMVAKAVTFVACWTIERRSSSQPAQLEAVPPDAYAAKAYAHALLSMAGYRGIYVVVNALLPVAQIAQVALFWSLCDRALLLVKGVSQVLQPRLVLGTVSARVKLLTGVGTVIGFFFVAVAMVAAAALLDGDSRYRDALPLGALLALAFTPHALRMLKMNEAVAEARFGDLFSSHALSLLAFVALAGSALTLGLHDSLVACWLVAGVSIAGLPFMFGRRPPQHKQPPVSLAE